MNNYVVHGQDGEKPKYLFQVVSIALFEITVYLEVGALIAPKSGSLSYMSSCVQSYKLAIQIVICSTIKATLHLLNFLYNLMLYPIWLNSSSQLISESF